jgi:hypothetical protein
MEPAQLGQRAVQLPAGGVEVVVGTQRATGEERDRQALQRGAAVLEEAGRVL